MKKQQSKKQKLTAHQQLIADKLRNNNLTTITFYKDDGSKQTQKVNDEFVNNPNGTRRSVFAIEKDIVAITHDLNCVKYSI